MTCFLCNRKKLTSLGKGILERDIRMLFSLADIICSLKKPVELCFQKIEWMYLKAATEILGKAEQNISETINQELEVMK